MNTLQAVKEIQDNTMTEELINEAKSIFSEGLIEQLHSSGMDIIESHAEGIYLYDIDGNAYIDCYSGASTYNLGRKNTSAIKVLKQSARETDHGNFVLISEEKATLANRLAGFISGNLSCSLFTVVRGEAMDAACKLARGYTGKTELISVDGGWYGDTGFALGLSDRSEKKQFGSLIPGQSIVEFNNIEAARNAINHDTAAFLLEPVQVENNCRKADSNYLRELKQLCDHFGTLLIFDETQTGFGRTGYKFSKDYYGVEPDILLFGEAITAGVFPMTGLAFTPKVKTFFDEHPLIHLCTFGGHDVGCKVAVHMLNTYSEKRPWEQTQKSGKRLMGYLNSFLGDNQEYIDSVGGMGLLISLRFRNTDLATAFCVSARNNGLFAVQGAVAKESVVLRPPLTITDEEIEMLAKVVKTALEKM